MKLSIICMLSVFLFSGASFALTDVEQDEFRARVSEMGRLKNGLAISLSGAGIVVYCTSGGALTGLSAVIDSVPIVATIQSLLMDDSVRNEMGRRRSRDQKAGYEVLGGLPAVAVDLFTAGFDITDLELDKPITEEMRIAYLETLYTAKKAFGETGYCVDQWDQLGILLGLK